MVFDGWRIGIKFDDSVIFFLLDGSDQWISLSHRKNLNFVGALWLLDAVINFGGVVRMECIETVKLLDRHADFSFDWIAINLFDS